MNKTHTISQGKSIIIENKLRQLRSCWRHSLRKPASARSVNADVGTPEKDALGMGGGFSPASFHEGVQSSITYPGLNFTFVPILFAVEKGFEPFICKMQQLPYSAPSVCTLG